MGELPADTVVGGAAAVVFEVLQLLLSPRGVERVGLREIPGPAALPPDIALAARTARRERYTAPSSGEDPNTQARGKRGEAL